MIYCVLVCVVWCFDGIFISDKDRRLMCRLDICGLCAFCSFCFIFVICVVGKWTYVTTTAHCWCPIFTTPSCIFICFAGGWHQQLSEARATSTSCRKRNRRSRRRRRGSGWGGRSNGEQSHDLPVSPLTQTAIQEGEATAQDSNVCSCQQQRSKAVKLGLFEKSEQH